MQRTILGLLIFGLIMVVGIFILVRDRPMPAHPIAILKTLSSDEMTGRKVGTAGNEMARTYILEQFEERGLRPLGEDFRHEFTFELAPRPAVSGINLLVSLPGLDRDKTKTIVITAHYDHVGEQDGNIYNGADDNASGVAALFALIDHFLVNPPEHDLVFAFLDAEESGLLGARAFLRDEMVPTDQIALNLNFDMISRSDKEELYAVGTSHYPQLEPLIDDIASESPISLLKGHDQPDPEDRFYDWTMSSDHGPFHQLGIPFIYFGVEDHPDYHQPGDDFEKIDLEFLTGSLQTITLAAEYFDQSL